MAKFRNSTNAPLESPQVAGESAVTAVTVHDRSIGDIIRHANNLTADQVEQVLQYQREKGVRFGEAAIALGLASDKDVLFALSQQFHYPYAPDEQQRKFSDELVVANKPFSHQADSQSAHHAPVQRRRAALCARGGEPRLR